ncbi:MAG: response regulator, partial [SAR324 cluster bacterium]|nr:response regulator [SAR324 cluster bacterium]
MSVDKSLNVLVVEDNANLRKVLINIINKLGFPPALEAEHGQEAWEKVQNEKVDIVLTDWTMPVMDGLKLISLIRGEPNLASMPICVITTEGAREDRERAISLGANEYLTKPIDRGRLLSVLNKYKQEAKTGPVLVVDDAKTVRDMVRRMLQKEGWEVAEAENGRVALDMLDETGPSLILLDLMMPEMDGLDLCAALKADARTSHIPVVLLTAKAEVEHRIKGFESGADAYLPKPFNAEELIVRVRTLVEGRRRLRRVLGRRPDNEATGSTSAPVEAEGHREAAMVLPQRELAFLETVRTLVEEHLGDTQFGVERLAEDLYLSRRQLSRKLRALVEESPVAMIRRMRL